MKERFGKYRGSVEDNIDPLSLGRVQVSVPAVLGTETLTWAMPCVPHAGKGVGFYFMPPVGANVWVEFEGGDIEYPIWSGCFWAVGETPSLPALPFVSVLATATFTLKIDETVPGLPQISLSLQDGPSLTLSQDGIAITTDLGEVTIKGTRISLNGDALEVI